MQNPGKQLIHLRKKNVGKKEKEREDSKRNRKSYKKSKIQKNREKKKVIKF